MVKLELGPKSGCSNLICTISVNPSQDSQDEQLCLRNLGDGMWNFGEVCIRDYLNIHAVLSRECAGRKIHVELGYAGREMCRQIFHPFRCALIMKPSSYPAWWRWIPLWHYPGGTWFCWLMLLWKGWSFRIKQNNHKSQQLSPFDQCYIFPPRIAQ